MIHQVYSSEKENWISNMKKTFAIQALKCVRLNN